MREASKWLKAPPASGGKPNKRVGRINVSSLLKSLQALSQYPHLSHKRIQDHGEQYVAEWESNLRQKEKDAFIAPTFGPLPVCLLFIRTSPKSATSAFSTLQSILKNLELLNQLSTDEHGVIPIIVWQGVPSLVVSFTIFLLLRKSDREF